MPWVSELTAETARRRPAAQLLPFFLQGRRDVAAHVDEADDVEVVGVFDVEEGVRKAFDGPGAELGEVELVGVAGRAGGGVGFEVAGRLFEGGDEASGDRRDSAR